MEFHEYKDLVKQISIGKKLPDSYYVHESAIKYLPPELIELTLSLIDHFKINDDDWNIIKFNNRDHKLTLLNYPDFESDSYPALHYSYTINIEKLSSREADYSKSENPPILHRKETFVADDYPLASLFKEITVEGEKIGLYEKTKSIGFKKNWERLISSKGYKLDENGRIILKNNNRINADIDVSNVDEIDRHKTAIDRNQLSQPMQILAKHDYLNGDLSIFDYGCGKGDDVRELEAHGLNINSWDPVYNPESKKINSDIVNLGFVLNVIEDRKERTETLNHAWKHAKTLLIVSVMVAGESVIRQFTPYKDGIVTSRNTFQKYYTQGEIREYLESTLNENAVAVGQGIFIIFRDKIEEQNFLSERQKIRRDWLYKTERIIQEREVTLKKDVIDKNLELFNDFWETSLELGRVPANNEFEFSEQIRRITGSHIKAHQALLKHYGDDLFKEAQTIRKEDLLLYFALGQFSRRKPQNKMPDGLKRDIKEFFNSYNEAIEEAREVLFSVGNPELINTACETAFKRFNCGYLDNNQSYTFHKYFLNELPLELRIYIGCATQLYGEIENFELIKVHIRSGKVSLMRYDNWENEMPMLLERIKIKMRDQGVDFFDYTGIYAPQPLENKSIFMAN